MGLTPSGRVGAGPRASLVVDRRLDDIFDNFWTLKSGTMASYRMPFGRLAKCRTRPQHLLGREHGTSGLLSPPARPVDGGCARASQGPMTRGKFSVLGLRLGTEENASLIMLARPLHWCCRKSYTETGTIPSHRKIGQADRAASQGTLEDVAANLHASSIRDTLDLLIKKIYSRRPYCGSDSACLNSQDARQMGQCCSAWLDSHLAMHGIITC